MQWDSLAGGIYTSVNSGATWTLQTSAPTNRCRWSAVASSADGTKLAASSSAGDYSGTFTSANSGSTWIYQTNGLPLPNPNCYGITMSSTGSKLTTLCGGQPFKSVDFGNTWTSCLSLPSQSTVLIAVSSVGTAGGAGFYFVNGNTLTLVYLGNGFFIQGDGNNIYGY
jgi:hypothetical protein